MSNEISNEDVQRLTKLLEIYQIDDINELLTYLKGAIKRIKYIQKLQRKADKMDIKSCLGYSRIGSDNWK